MMNTYFQFRLLCLHWVAVGLLGNTDAGFVGFLLFATCLEFLSAIFDAEGGRGWGSAGVDERGLSLRWASFYNGFGQGVAGDLRSDAFRLWWTLLMYCFDAEVVRFSCATDSSLLPEESRSEMLGKGWLKIAPSVRPNDSSRSICKSQ